MLSQILFLIYSQYKLLPISLSKISEPFMNMYICSFTNFPNSSF